METGGHAVIVVGAGPAGAATAARLAARGHRTLLLDRDEFPRRKPCGECVSPAAVAALDRLGALPRVREQPHARLRGWRVHPLLAAAFQGTFVDGAEGVGIQRAVLDRVLWEHAERSGAAVRTGARVVDLEREEGRVVGVRLGRENGREVVRARLVVGADGLRSVVVRRTELLRRPPRLRKLALTAHAEGITGLQERGELHVFPWGCVGVARVAPDRANVTVVLNGAEGGRLSGDKGAYFDHVLAAHARFQGARRVDEALATGPFDWPTRAVVADHVLLVGDAAGYYDPFTGQGIFRALRGAELAAHAADSALRSGDLSARALAPYQREHHRAFAAGQRLQRVIEAFVSHPRLLDAVAGRFRRRPALADGLISVTADLRPVRSLLNPRLLAQLLA